MRLGPPHLDVVEVSLVNLEIVQFLGTRESQGIQPALHLIEPAGVDGSVVELVARQARQPGLNLGKLVGGRSCPRSDGSRPRGLPDPLIPRSRAGP